MGITSSCPPLHSVGQKGVTWSSPHSGDGIMKACGYQRWADRGTLDSGAHACWLTKNLPGCQSLILPAQRKICCGPGPLCVVPVFSFPVQFSSVAQSCLTLCDPMDCSTPGLPVHHQLPEFTKLTSIESVMPSNHLILCRPFSSPNGIKKKFIVIPFVLSTVSCGHIFTNTYLFGCIGFQLHHVGLAVLRHMGS